MMFEITILQRRRDSYEKEKGGRMLTKVITFAIEEYQSFMNALTDTELTTNEEKLEIIES